MILDPDVDDNRWKQAMLPRRKKAGRARYGFEGDQVFERAGLPHPFAILYFVTQRQLLLSRTHRIT